MREFNLQDNIQALQDESSYHIPNEIEVQGIGDNALSASLEGAARPGSICARLVF